MENNNTEESIFPRWMSRVLSYLSAYLLGGYTNKLIEGEDVNIVIVVTVLITGVYFFALSQPEKE